MQYVRRMGIFLQQSFGMKPQSRNYNKYLETPYRNKKRTFENPLMSRSMDMSSQNPIDGIQKVRQVHYIDLSILTKSCQLKSKHILPSSRNYTLRTCDTSP